MSKKEKVQSPVNEINKQSTVAREEQNRVLEVLIGATNEFRNDLLSFKKKDSETYRSPMMLISLINRLQTHLMGSLHDYILAGEEEKQNMLDIIGVFMLEASGKFPKQGGTDER